MTKFYAVVAMSENRVIGSKGKLPWPTISEDMYRFRALTENQHVIMGRKTYESLPSNLPNRTKHVLTYTPSKYSKTPDTYFWNSRRKLNDWLAYENINIGLIIGGREIYDSYWHYITRIYMTILHSQIIPGDTSFRQLHPDKWIETSRIYQELNRSDRSVCDISFVTLERHT